MAQQNEKFDTARKNIFPPVGANSYEVTHQAIESLPQGNNTTLDKVLLQAARRRPRIRPPAASCMSATSMPTCSTASTAFMLPDGVGGFGQFLDYRHCRQHGAPHRRAARAIWPAHGRRARYPDQDATRSTIPARSASMAAAIRPSRRLSNMAARSDKPSITSPAAIFGSNLGIENPTPANDAIHDRTQQEKGFALSLHRARSDQPR